MKRYHLCKATRLYDFFPYAGPTSEGIRQEYDTLDDAKKVILLLNKINPVGWDIYDSTTGEKVN